MLGRPLRFVLGVDPISQRAHVLAPFAAGNAKQVPRHTSGTLTGSRVAGRVRRWPVEAAMRAVLRTRRCPGWVGSIGRAACSPCSPRRGSLRGAPSGKEPSSGGQRHAGPLPRRWEAGLAAAQEAHPLPL